MQIALTALLSVASIVAAGVVALRAVVPGADRAAGAVHVLMGLGMAGMFSPWGDPTPPAAGAAVFAVAAAWFLARLLRSGGSDELHLGVGSAAMVLMYLSAPSSGATPDGAHAGHAGHSASVTGSSGGWLMPVVGLALAGYFAWYAWHVLRRPESEHTPVGGTAVVTRAVGIEPVAHAVLSAVMATMFVLGV